MSENIDKNKPIINADAINEVLSRVHKGTEEAKRILSSINVHRDYIKNFTVDKNVEKLYNKFISENNNSFEAISHASFYQEKEELLTRISQLKKDLDDKKRTNNEIGAQFEALLDKYNENERRGQLTHILSRVSEKFRGKIISDKKFLGNFSSGNPSEAYIISIDIRKSTSLMLKAKSSQLFANFMTILCEKLKDIIIKYDGVFDKFTGDGILAYFPKFLNKKNLSSNLVMAACECREVFQRHYAESRNCFSAILLDTGLGIGIDYGKVNIVRVGSEITIVGEAVVYACRLGGGPANSIYCNQPAAEKIGKDLGDEVILKEESAEFKHEGKFLAYSINKKNEKPIVQD